MSYLPAPARPIATTLLGLGVASFAGQSIAGASIEPMMLEATTIQAQPHPGHLSEFSASSKYSAPLLDTPQTITVVPQTLIAEQQALSLRQVLSNVSGITFNAGEGGGGSGDSINVRGFSADSSLQLDGLRDSAQTTRSDTFNIEQVEVIKGPNSVFGGAGTTGGTLNIISKQPRPQTLTQVTGSLGTDGYRRLTLDSNQPLHDLGSGSAVRLNLMAHHNEVPGRKNIERERWGIAPSLQLGLTETTRLTLSAFHQVDDNLPDYGVPATDGKRLEGVPRKAYFGWRNLDKEQIDQSNVTVKLEHRFNDDLHLHNLTRYGQIHRDTVISASHVNTQGLPAGRYRPAGPQAYGRYAHTRLLINQSQLSGMTEWFGMTHDMKLGLELSREDLELKTYDYGLNATRYPGQGYPIGSPPGYWAEPVSKRAGAYTETQLNNQAVYLLDTITLGPQWELNLGARYDQFVGRVDKPATTQKAAERFDSVDNTVSSRVGVVYKPTGNGRFYLAWGNSFNPSAEALVGNTRGLDAATEGLSPENNHTWELGTKWLLLERQLELDAALFRVDKRNAREGLADGSTQLAGRQRVQGIEVGLTGHINEQWSVFANYTFLDSETLKAAATPNGFARTGQALANTPPRSFNLWTTYRLPAGWTLGYGARHVSERNVTSSTRAKLDAYWVHNAMIGYQVSPQLDLQLNASNLFNKVYVERVRQQSGNAARSSAIEYGDGRAAVLSAVYQF